MRRKRTIKPFAAEREVRERYFSTAKANEYDAKHFSDFVGRQRNERQIAIVDSMLKRIKPPFVVDIGAGTGRLSFSLKNVPKMIATDSSEEMLSVARKRAGPNQECIKADAFRLPFESGTVPCIMTSRLVWHFDANTRKRFYAEVKRALVNGGHFILDAPNARAGKVFFRTTFSGEPSPGTQRWAKSDLVNELSQNGFRVIKLQGLVYGAPVVRALTRLSNKSPRLANNLFKTNERMRLFQPSEWFVLCQKR